MDVLIVTDIFGVCESTDKLIAGLKSTENKLHLVDPYDGERHAFKNENEAYSAFIEHCGHEKYLSLAQNAIEQINPAMVIGFSAGANAVWRLCDLPVAMSKKLICFYPTRIQQYLALEAKACVEVIFPLQEASFDVREIAQVIDCKNNVSQQIMPFDHGFMNNRSQAFNKEAEKLGFELIQTILKKP